MTDYLAQEARRRILILDGAMGTMIQAERFDEDAFLGHGGAGHNCALHTDHPQAGNKIWISRREVRTHAIFQRPPSEMTAPPANTATDPDDFPPAAA